MRARFQQREGGKDGWISKERTSELASWRGERGEIEFEEVEDM